jgi:hypothetical protein
MWLKTILCRIGLHKWSKWECTNYTFETGKVWYVKKCKICLARKYRS